MKLLDVFFEDPELKIHLRALARKMNKHPSTISKEIKKHKSILNAEKKDHLIEISSKNNEAFRRQKQIDNLRKIYESEVIDLIKEEYNIPEAIILFGSYARGEDTKRSDIDIAIITKQKKELDLKKYEKKLKRPIQLLELSEIGEEMFESLSNGIVLEGYLEWKTSKAPNQTKHSQKDFYNHQERKEH